MKAVVRILSLLIILVLSNSALAQCDQKVSHLTGTKTINGVKVTVTNSGVVDSNVSYCDATSPYFIGWNYGLSNSGTGSYTFTFSPAIREATLNFSGISSTGSDTEEVVIIVNGKVYPIKKVGTDNGCDPLGVLTSEGAIGACQDCSVAGWNGTKVKGKISKLTVRDVVVSGSPAGAIFSLFICADEKPVPRADLWRYQN